jgi:hypothetical protein
MFPQSTARKAISGRLRIGLALVLATVAITGTGASSAMAGTSHGGPKATPDPRLMR